MRWFSKSGIVQVCSVTISCPCTGSTTQSSFGSTRGRRQDVRRGFRGYSGAGLSTTGGFSLQFFLCVICYSWAAVSTPPYERLPPFSTPHDPRAGVQRENGSGAYIPFESSGTGPLAEKQLWCTIPSCTALCSRGATAQKTVREQRTRARSTRPYLDTLVTFLWYDLLISGGLRSVGGGASLPRVTTLSFPPLFLVCNTLLLNGGARTMRGRPWRGARVVPPLLGGLAEG